MATTSVITADKSGTARGGALVPSARGMVSNVRALTVQPSFQRAFPTLVALVVVVAGLVAYFLLQQPSRTSLFASLAEADKQRVVETLTNAGVDVTLDPTTGEVLVPSADYYSSRMTLAAQGLPASDPSGMDELNNMPMGTSRSVEQAKLKHAQEVELARSINEIYAVVSARVHLALPDRTAFVREQLPPKASVFVQLGSGRTLDESQVTAIINLVSTSVSGMSRENVTIVDQRGRLLSQPSDDPAAILGDTQLQYRMRLENIYRTRIESIVTPIVGPGNVNAQVNLEIDFTRSEITEQSVDPASKAILSEQSTLDVSSNPEAKGIPGAVANTAPQEATMTAAQTTATEAAASNTGARSSSEVKNYEISRKVETTTTPSNRIARIDAAVLLRNQTVIDPETGLPVEQPLPAETLAQIKQLVAGTIGLQETRGDTLMLSSQPFIMTLDGVSVDWYQTDWIMAVAKQGVTVLLLAVVALGVVRPLLQRVLVPSGASVVAQGGLSDEETEALESIEVKEGESLEEIKAKLKPKKSNISLEMLDTANTYDDKVAIIRMIVSDEAGRVSNVFKQMMKKDLDLVG
ncbi:flagellar basal-body MS-ring/collar protein FliF [Cypionkella sp.]|uniref:flagellar basal-body MS-ring/collar protein FliF n=1 Tax=Cypionkella sp. TaxID=2811411 RepID=UPI002FDD4353